MIVGEICSRETIIISTEETVFDAARLMQQYNVGSLVVVEEGAEGNTPIGIVTDRDIVVKSIANNDPVKSVIVKDIMGKDLLTVLESDGIYEALKHMQAKGVRRVPVSDSKGYLTGILTLDDIMEFLSKEIGAAVEVLKKEQPVIR